MNSWQQDLHRMATDMDHATDDVEQACFDPDEYADTGFPQEHRREIVTIVDRWDNACGDLQYAAREMAELAERIAT